MQEILGHIIFENTIYSYLTAFGFIIGGIAIAYVFRRYVVYKLMKWSEKTKTSLDDLFVNIIKSSFIPLAFFGVVYFALNTLILSASFERGLKITTATLITLLVARAIIALANYALSVSMQASSNAEQKGKQLKGIRRLINFVIWALALVFLLDNMGVEISAVVAGLGIGGIAVALAAQTVLGDLFSYFVIFFDKPFEIGDFISIDDKVGVVEHVGIKTTRIRALSGEQLVLSNTDLTNSRVHNFKKLEKRRVVFKLGMTYQTSAAKLKNIPGIVKEIISEQDGATFDRGHFASYGDFSLNFEFVYYVTGADYAKYMDIQQAINLNIFEVFEKEQIEFAYPTQTIFINKNN